MESRKFGRLGFEVSELGFGTWGFDQRLWHDADPEGGKRALAHAVASGVNFVDTAVAYGNGTAESLIGETLQQVEGGASVRIATKITPKVMLSGPSPHIPATAVYPGDHVRASVEASLKRLRRECIDLIQLHAWASTWIDDGDWEETLEALKKEGKILGWGVSVFDHDGDSALALVDQGRCDSVQIVFSLFDQTPTLELLPLCALRGVAVIARAALYHGALASPQSATKVYPENDFRRLLFSGGHGAECRDRALRIADNLQEGETLADLALRFVVSHPQVTTMIVGMRSSERVEQNIAVIEQPKLTREHVLSLRQHNWLA